MREIPSGILWRRDEYCRVHCVAIETARPRGWGVDAYIWQTTADTILKVHYNQREFRQELAVYQRLAETRTDRLQGFDIPILLHYDEDLLVLELSYVRPPFVLDFAGAGLDQQPHGFDPASPGWNAEKRRLYGERWPEVVRLLDALRHLGIHYIDVHLENICFADPGGGTSPSPTRPSWST